MSGTLYVVATPIGNLSDITLRALEVLRAVPCIAAEDTRRTRVLLSHFEIRGKALVSCPAHASASRVERLVGRLAGGEDVAFVSDAGTPAVSDPGAALVRSAAAAGVSVIPVPGPSALTAAIAASGLIEGPFTFLGFLPVKGAKRRELVERIARTPEPFVLFEAPQRATRTLEELARLTPERPAALCRELSKLHEEITRGSLAELAGAATTWRGEITLILGYGTPPSAPDPANEPDLDAEIERRLRAGQTPRDVARALAAELGLARREVYARVSAAALTSRRAGPNPDRDRRRR